MGFRDCFIILCFHLLADRCRDHVNAALAHQAIRAMEFIANSSECAPSITADVIRPLSATTIQVILLPAEFIRSEFEHSGLPAIK